MTQEAAAAASGSPLAGQNNPAAVFVLPLVPGAEARASVSCCSHVDTLRLYLFSDKLTAP